mmetsp:Transcript_71223/g.119129  ORF Transcript_71223/g.119129 Transcript_71223/m.119129 type:complete len:341 (+) Transcript_71223:410-1432(+)
MAWGSSPAALGAHCLRPPACAACAQAFGRRLSSHRPLPLSPRTRIQLRAMLDPPLLVFVTTTAPDGGPVVVRPSSQYREVTPRAALARQPRHRVFCCKGGARRNSRLLWRRAAALRRECAIPNTFADGTLNRPLRLSQARRAGALPESPASTGPHPSFPMALGLGGGRAWHTPPVPARSGVCSRFKGTSKSLCGPGAGDCPGTVRDTAGAGSCVGGLCSKFAAHRSINSRTFTKRLSHVCLAHSALLLPLDTPSSSGTRCTPSQTVTRVRPRRRRQKGAGSHGAGHGTPAAVATRADITEWRAARGLFSPESHFALYRTRVAHPAHSLSHSLSLSLLAGV